MFGIEMCTHVILIHVIGSTRSLRSGRWQPLRQWEAVARHPNMAWRASDGKQRGALLFRNIRLPQHLPFFNALSLPLDATSDGNVDLLSKR